MQVEDYDSTEILNPMDFMNGGRTMTDCILDYANALQNRDNDLDDLHATKVVEYTYTKNAEASAIAFMYHILEYFSQIVPSANIQCLFRVKSFLSFERKINRTLIRACNEEECDDVDYKVLINGLNEGLKDTLGFRFIVHGRTDQEAIANIYVLANHLIPEMARNGLIVQGNPTLRDVDSDSPSLDDSPILTEYRTFFKDHILHQKRNGYQSLHIIFWSAALGRYIEIQFRTATMHFYAEYGKPAHRSYKQKKYTPVIPDTKLQPVVEAIERLKLLQNPDISAIDIQHFYIDGYEDGIYSYFDGAGLIKPLIRKEMVLVDRNVVVVR